MHDIKGYTTFTKIEPVNKGWSGDKKYYIFIKAEESGNGYAALFDWADAECMGRMYPLSRRKFMQMPLKMRVQVFEEWGAAK